MSATGLSGKSVIAPGGTVTGIGGSASVDREAHGPSVLVKYMGNLGRVAAP